MSPNFPVNNYLPFGPAGVQVYGYNEQEALLGCNTSEKGFVPVTAWGGGYLTVFEYDPKSNRWSKKSIVSSNSYDRTMAAVSNFFMTQYSFSSRDVYGNFYDIYYTAFIQYNPQTGTLKNYNSGIPRNDYLTSSTAFLTSNEKYIYAVLINSKDFGEFEITTGTWKKLNSVPENNFLGGFVIDNTIYAATNSSMYTFYRYKR
jgi:hypothetical protein